MTRDEVLNDYFAWLYDIVCKNNYPKEISFKKLLMQLHDTEFRFSIPRDQNRAGDGIALRYRFASIQVHEDMVDVVLDYLEGPCSVLEMMIALALRCEETITDEHDYGDRTGQWFWGMIVNMGLGAMTDVRYDKREVTFAIDRLLDREYEYDGRYGLFRLRNPHRDMRTAEIWHQLCWYLDALYGDL